MSPKTPGTGHRASGLGLYILCPRRYYYAKTEGVDSPAGKAAEFGTFIHQQYEDYFRGQRRRDELHELCRRGLDIGVYPEPCAPGLKVEHRFQFTFDRLRYTGTMDLRQCPRVWDHKTSGNPEVWAIGGSQADPEPLLNLQGAMYIYATSLASRGKPVDGLWVIHHTENKTWKPRVVGSFDITPSRAKEAFGDLVHIRGLAVHDAMRKAKCAEDMEPKLESCYAYGKPCPALAFCTVDRREHLTKAFDGGTVATMGLFTSEPATDNAPVLPGPYETATVGRDPAQDRAAYTADDDMDAAVAISGAAPQRFQATPAEAAAAIQTLTAPAGPGTHGKHPPLDVRGLSVAGQKVLDALTEYGPMDFASSAKSATDRRPFVNLRTLKAMSAKKLIFYVDNGDYRSVRLPHHPEQPSGYTPAPAVNAPETSRMSPTEKDKLSRAVLTNSEELKRRAAKEADIQSATDLTVRALLPAIRSILDYASAHGVDLLGELDVPTTTEEST